MSRPPRVVSATPRLAAQAREQRRERRRVLLRRAGWVAAGVLPLLLLAWVLLGSSMLAVDRVVVAGEKRLTAQQVEAAVDVAKGTPLARVDTAAVARRVRALGPVDAVSVTRSWPSVLRITVVERVPVVGVAREGKLALLDDHGVEVDRVAALPRGVFRLTVPSGDAEVPSTRAALAVLQQLPKPLRDKLGSLRASSPEQVSLVLRDGRVVVWGSPADSAAKAAAVAALLRMPGRVYDVSSPGVVTRR